MAEPFELPSESERLQINLRDDVRAFLLGRLRGNRMSPEQRAEAAEMGIDLKRLGKPSYLTILSGTDLTEDGNAPENGCAVGAEGYMIHEDEPLVHLAFKCGDKQHEMHYTRFMPMSVIEMAKAMETIWPGSIMGPMRVHLAKIGRLPKALGEPLDEEGAQKILKAIERMDEEGPDFDFEESELDDVDIDEDVDDDALLDELEDDEDEISF